MVSKETIRLILDNMSRVDPVLEKHWFRGNMEVSHYALSHLSNPEVTIESMKSQLYSRMCKKLQTDYNNVVEKVDPYQPNRNFLLEYIVLKPEDVVDVIAHIINSLGAIEQDKINSYGK
jgi:hypothetical protein